MEFALAHLAPLSITSRAFHSKLKCQLFKNSYPDYSLIIHPSNLNVTHLNSYSVPSDPLEIGPVGLPRATLWTISLIRRIAHE